MSEEKEIINDIDKLDGMIKIKGKCGYEIIGGCKEFRRLQQELQKYKDMEVKGLEEFKDVGGCWGCGLELQLEQDYKDINRLMEENEKLLNLANNGGALLVAESTKNKNYKQALEDIKEIINFRFKTAYITFGLKETNKIIEDIDKIVNEVLQNEKVHS